MNLQQFKRVHDCEDLSRETLLSLLQNTYESEFHDFKERIDMSDPISIGNLAKHVAAFHNHIGGYIVFGVQDGSFKKVGFPSAPSLDTKRIMDQLRTYLGDCVKVVYSHHELDGLRFGLLYVSRRDSVPVLMLKDGPAKGHHHAFRKNDICIRDGDETRVVNDAVTIGRLFSVGPSQGGLTDGVSYHQEPLKKLIKPDFRVFIGREPYKQELMAALSLDERAWIVSINGVGGVGKTALATWGSWQCYSAGTYDVVISVSAKARELTRTGIRPIAPTLVSYDNLLTEIAEVIGYPFHEETPIEQKEREVRELLTLGTTLLVVDNYETIEDERIGEFLRNLKGRTKALITSRKRAGKGEYPIVLKEMETHESRRYVYHLASELGVDRVFASPEDDIEKLIAMSGKLPLAMKWLVAQVKLRGDIATVLAELDRPDHQVGDVLEFCFRGIFKVLSGHAQHLLCVMPVFQKPPTYIELKMASGLSDAELDSSLEQLKDISLLDEVLMDSGERRHRVLPLTLRFSQNELSKRRGLEETARKRLAGFYNLYSPNVAAAQGQYQALYECGAGTQKERAALYFAQMAGNAYRKGDYEEALALYKHALDVLPSSRDALLGWAQMERQEGNFGKAEELLEQAASTPRGKNDAMIWHSWGNMLKDLERWDEAAGKFEAVARIQPQNAKALHQLAFCHSLAGHFKLADEYYDRILLIKPPVSLETQVYAYTGKAQNYFKWGRLLDSTMAWSKVLELDPENGHAQDEKKKTEARLAESGHRPRHAKRAARVASGDH